MTFADVADIEQFVGRPRLRTLAIVRNNASMKFELLPLLATLALYANWKFASPFMRSPTLSYAKGLLRHLPLMLFVVAGILLSIAIPNFGQSTFAISLGVSVAMMLTGLALPYCR